MDREIVVRGEAEVRAMPDLAIWRVVVDGEGSSRQDAYEAAARLAAAVDEVLHDQSVWTGRVTTAALVVEPRTRWRKGETVRTGWRAHRMSVVEVRSLDRVGDLAALLVGAGGSLAGPSWELDKSNDAHGKARLEAGRDARRRAEEYAESLGVDLGPVAWIAEPGLRFAGGGPGFAVASRARMPPGAVTEGPIEVAPEEITVRAAVEVGFRISDL